MVRGKDTGFSDNFRVWSQTKIIQEGDTVKPSYENTEMKSLPLSTVKNF